MPGERWLNFARAWFDERTVAIVIEPQIADWRHDWSEAAGWRAIVVYFRGQFAILSSTLGCLATHGLHPLPAWHSIGMLVSVGGFAAVGALALIASSLASGSAPRIDVATLLPSALCIALPLASVPALILVATGASAPPRTRRWLAVRAAIVLTAAMVLLAGFAVPAVNQAWRERNAPAGVTRPILRGDREMTLAELFTANVSPMVPELLRQREAHNRVAVILMPISLCALGVAASRRVRHRYRAAVAWWIVAGAQWFLVMPVAIRMVRWTALDLWAPWAPHVVLLVVAALLGRDGWRTRAVEA